MRCWRWMMMMMMMTVMVTLMVVVMVVTQAHGDPSPLTHSEVVLQQRLHGAHDSRDSQEDQNDPFVNFSRPSKRSVLDSLLELSLRHEDEKMKDEDEHKDKDQNKDEAKSKEENKGNKDEIFYENKRTDKENDEKENKNEIEGKDKNGEAFSEDEEAASFIEEGLGVLTEVRPALHTLLRQLQGETETLALPDNHSTPANDSQRPPLLDYLNELRRNAWGHFRDMTMGYVNLLDAEYEAQGLQEGLPLGLIRSVLQAGDTANLLRVFGSKLDPNLLGFLQERVGPLMFSLSEAGRGITSLGSVFGGSFSSQPWRFLKEKVGPLLFTLTEDGRSITSLEAVIGQKLDPKLLGFLREGVEPLLFSLTEAGRDMRNLGDTLRNAMIRVARAAVHHFIDHVLWVTRNDVTKEELLQYREDLRLKVPLAAVGLDILLGNESSASDARSYGSYGGGAPSYGGYGNFDGYGGHGGYGSSHGYGIYLDPYLILAAIGAAALLAFLGYRVILARSTVRRRRRDNHLEDTDLPEALQGLKGTPGDDYYFRYDFGRSLGIADDLDDLAEALNALWRQRENDPRCMSCWVTRYAATHQSPARPALTPLLVSVMAHLMGASRSGQLMDEATGQVLEGRPVTCPRRAYTCDFQ